MVQLDPAVLVSADEQFKSDVSVLECVGDSFLCSNNFMYATIRRVFLARGFGFISDADPRTRNYFAAPLMALDTLLDEGLVPYRRNLSVLKYLIGRNPTFTIVPSFLCSTLAHNYMMHESAHLIAAYALASTTESTAAAGGKDTVLLSILGESFANTIEALSLAFAHISYLHRFLLCLNSYLTYDNRLPGDERTFRELLTNFGFGPVFRIAFLGFLHSNLHDFAPAVETVDSWLEEIPFGRALNQSDVSLLRMIMGSKFRLSAGFRRNTTPHFFKLSKLESDYQSFRSVRFSKNDLRTFDIMPRINRVFCSCWSEEDLPLVSAL